jgi:predicted dehydrogenase
MIEISKGRPLRGALVGHGFIAEQGHLPAYAANAKRGGPFEIVAIADTCAARREAARRTHPNARIYEDYAALLSRETGVVDFVDVTTPPAFHAEVAHAALDRGLHVLCEKPLSTTAEEARSLLDHAVRVRRVLYPSHNYKHAPVIKRVREVIAAGRIGRPTLVTLHTFRTTHAKGVSEWHSDWRRERRYSGGGIAMDHGSHTFYLAFEWLGAYPSAISATSSTLDGYDTEDNLACSIRFPTGMATAHLTWTAGFRKVIYTIHGSQGAIRVEDDDLEVTSTAGGAREVTRERLPSDWMDASHVGWFDSLFDDFANAIDRREYVGKEAEDALRCVELITAAYSSARRSGRELPLGVGPRAVPKLAVGGLVGMGK